LRAEILVAMERDMGSSIQERFKMVFPTIDIIK
jgi:hypothetical protein